MQHELKVDKSFKLATRKKESFHPEKQLPINEEVDTWLVA